MGGWPELAQLMGGMPNISPFGISGPVLWVPLTTVTSGLWPGANRAVFVPIRLSRPVVVTKFWVVNGATVAGNVDIGVYDLSGCRIASTGSTAQAGVSAFQAIDVTDFTVGPGGFYLAMAMDDATATTMQCTPAIATLRLLGLAQQESAFPLPATATLATLTATSRIPVFGLSTRVTV